MEEIKPDQNSVNHVTATVLPSPARDPPPQTAPPPSPPPPPPLPSRNNKRKAGDLDIQNTPYYKIRAIVHELRPHFIEVLRTPDFRSCKAADEIKKQMKVVMDLYKQMIVEVEPAVSMNTNAPDSRARENMLRKESREGYGEGKHPDGLEKSGEKAMPPPPSSFDKKGYDGLVMGSYIVGGSVFGWNFVTFVGSKPVYYGMTKEVYRSFHPLTETVVDARTDAAEIPAEKESIEPSADPVDSPAEKESIRMPADIPAEKESNGIAESMAFKSSD